MEISQDLVSKKSSFAKFGSDTQPTTSPPNFVNGDLRLTIALPGNSRSHPRHSFTFPACSSLGCLQWRVLCQTASVPLQCIFFKNCHDFLLQEQRSVLCKEVGRTTKSDKPAFPATMLDIVFHVFVFRFFEQVFSPPTHLVFLFFETPLRLVPLEIRSS